jgi:hypothetical protein
MTLTRFYHTERRGYVLADVYDLGTKPQPEPALTGDEQLTPEGLTQNRRHKPSTKQEAIMEAAKQPGIISDIARRAGVSKDVAIYATRFGWLRQVGEMRVGGRVFKVWGLP